MIYGKVRAVIRFLQIYPLLTVVAFLIDVVLDTLGINATEALDFLFGVSAFPVVCLWLLARRLCVSLWSRVLYATLLVVIAVTFADWLFGFPMTIVMFDRVMFAILSTGVLSSLVTHIYTKYRHNGNIQGNSEHGARQEQAVE